MRDLNVWTSSKSDGTTRNSVPDLLVTVRAAWQDNDGVKHDEQIDRYLLVQLAWLRTNHPKAAQKLAEELVLEIEKLRRGIKDVREIDV